MSEVRALVGTGGWLFLDGDHNATVQQIRGGRVLSPRELSNWHNELTYRKQIMSELGIRFLFLVAPNKERIYKEYLPPEVTFAETTTFDQVKYLFEEVGVNFIAPVDELISSRSVMDTYPKIDTHWNDYGALVATNTVLGALGKNIIDKSDCEFTAETWNGDLGGKLNPVQSGSFYRGRLKGSARRGAIYDNRIVHGGHVTVHVNANVDQTIVVFGDSFAEFQLPWLSERYGTVIFIHSTAFDMEVIEHFKPDFVLWEYVERFLIVYPVPALNFSIHDYLAKKIATQPLRALRDILTRETEASESNVDSVRFFSSIYVKCLKEAVDKATDPI